MNAEAQQVSWPIVPGSGSELFSQFLIIENLPVADGNYSFILVAYGLMTAFEVDDAESAKSQANMLVHVEPV